MRVPGSDSQTLILGRVSGEAVWRLGGRMVRAYFSDLPNGENLCFGLSGDFP